ncbi:MULTISPECIES: DUF4148 domain-containing protein [unclassified Burkholderia]|uniref:DUF4148 domain-containing protein n=1 Tax=unclassified Burkholderia TaxID=2613784 RepID=UPI0010F47785|nr:MULTISPECIES: DUF4148 domain-containing protein [unclassified Burkholderia]
MKRATFTAGVALLVFASTAIAQTSSGTPGKTREQVRAELVQAYRDGLVPYSRNDYPPSASTIARNKVLYGGMQFDAASATHANRTPLD